MVPVTYALRLDVQANGSQTCIVVREGDRRTRALRVRLVQGSAPYLLDAVDTVLLRAMKPDGYEVISECAVDGNVIEVPLSEQLMVAPGLVHCEMQVADAQGALLTSPQFDIAVEGVLFGDGGALSSGEYGALIDTIARAKAMIRDVEERLAEGAFDGEDGKSPVVGENGNWLVWDEETEAFVDTGFPSRGEGATLDIVETRTGAPNTFAEVKDAPDSTPTHRRYVLFVPRGADGDGSGDMRKIVYDQSGNGVVDDAERLGGKQPEEFVVISESMPTAAGPLIWFQTDYAEMERIVLESSEKPTIYSVLIDALSSGIKNMTDDPAAASADDLIVREGI